MKVLVWEALGSVAPRGLSETRLVLHHAVQLVAAVGRTLVPARPDDGHTSLEWHRTSRSFLGEEVPGPRPWRAALRPEDLSLAVLAEGDEFGRLTLAGRTLDEGFAWLLGQARDLGTAADRLTLKAPYTLPPHALGARAVFAAPGDGSLIELSHWFADGAPRSPRSCRSSRRMRPLRSAMRFGAGRPRPITGCASGSRTGA